MRQLRIFRIFLATIFFIASVAYLAIGAHVHPMAVVSEKSQIILSAVAVSIGATLVWLILTFIFGRIYCSTVCPIGTLSDIFIRLRRRIPRLNRDFRYRERRRWSVHILIIYIISLLIGAGVVPFIIEPWNMMRNMVSTVNISATEMTWGTLAIGTGAGIICGIITFIFIAIYALLRGREFCTDICPLGSAFGLLHEHTLYHIEINPDKCISCGECENVCRASCIKTVSRFVDNSRCVRCFDCLAVCPNDAIRYQPNRNCPATPLMRKVKKTT